MTDATKADAIETEGNKRGSAVTDPSLPPNSSNAKNGEETQKSKARAAAAAADAKGADADDDDDDDDDDDASSKSRKARKAKKAKKMAKLFEAMLAKMGDMDDDDDDDDDDARKDDDYDDDDDDDDDDKKKSSKARKAKKTKKSDSDDLAKSLVSALVNAGIVGGSNMRDPRAAPSLMAVGKDGAVTKLDIETLKKSVDPINNDDRPLSKADVLKDDDTARLIKAIHANHIVLDNTDLRALGQIGALR